VILPRAVRDAVVAHAREASPAECCGLLVGSPGEITSAVRAGNLSENPKRFLVDPKDHIRARRDARAAGLDVVGFYHSHPHSAAEPSETDAAEAWTYPNHLHLIVGLAGEAADVRLYRFTGETFELEIADTGTNLDHHGR
jgi:proteasome lid subunit RPN8/RPN11